VSVHDTKMPIIVARNLLFQLAEEDLADASLISNVDRFAVSRGIASVIITNDGKLLFSSNTKKLHLKSGAWTLQKCLGLSRIPIRLESYAPLPDNFIIKYFADGYDEAKIYHTIGEKFTRVQVDLVLQNYGDRERIRKTNQHILSTDTTNLVQDGTVSILDVSRVEQGKKMLRRNMREICRNPDLDGPITLTFEQYAIDGPDDCPAKLVGKFPPIEITLVGRPGQTRIKRKHYAIYSKLPGFGKTYHMERLEEMYNVHIVNDTNNWTTVPYNAQILVLDEVGYVHNRLDFDNLKALTGGTASSFTGNCKTFGDSFIPRKDVQVIMLSNRPPYDIYGKWNAALGRRIMTTEEIDQFHARFKVFRLDGSLDEDIAICSTPDEWSDEQFRNECRHIVDRMFASLNSKEPVERHVTAMIHAVDVIVNLCQQREAKDIFAVDAAVSTVLTEVDEGRLVPSLVETFYACYEGMATKRKGRALTIARDRLIRQASIEEARFDGMILEQLTRHIADNPSSAYGLFRFYTSSPRYIDFNCDDKERVFRACLSVHNTTVDDDYMYRTAVFERVWNISRENSSKKRKLDSAYNKNDELSLPGFVKRENEA